MLNHLKLLVWDLDYLVFDCSALKVRALRQSLIALADLIPHSVRLPDAYVWAKAYALDALCEVAVARGMPRAMAWVDELQQLAARCGMRELTVRAHLHRARLGDAASGEAALVLASAIDSPLLLGRAKELVGSAAVGAGHGEQAASL